jgi:CO/xanthine dehydrogenase FAD-binding subunit
MKAFDYERPSSFEDACRLLKEAGGSKKALAGGTDLLIKTRQKVISPKGMISLRDVPGLSDLSFNPEKGLTIGAMTRLSEVEIADVVKENYPALAAAVATIGSTQVRNRATIGGNKCNAAPSADSMPILIAYGASVVIGDGQHEREVLLEEFFTGPGQTVLQAGELVKQVFVPVPPQNSFAIYIKAARSALDIALVGVALVAVYEPSDGVIKDLKVALAAVAPTPVRSRQMEGIVIGNRLDDEIIEKAVGESCTDACSITDVRTTEGYRDKLVETHSRQALEATRSWIEKGGVL